MLAKSIGPDHMLLLAGNVWVLFGNEDLLAAGT